MFRTIREAGDLLGKRVLLRLDLNVPIRDGKVFDDFRIKASLATLNFLKERGAKIIILSHISGVGKETLRPVADYLEFPLLPLAVGDHLRKYIVGMQNGEAIILENLRQDKREVENDAEFAKELASLGEIYVNEAFSESHKNYVSMVALPKLLPSYAGFLLESEIENLSKLFTPEHPFLFILGGAKFETKINLVKKFLDIADQIFVAGALSNTIFKKMGYETGQSLVDEKDMNLEFVLSNKKVILPIDVTVRDAFGDSVKLPNQVLKSENMLDMGPASLELLKKMIDSSKYVLWNGPMGSFEKGLKQVTEDLAIYLSKSNAKTIVGGGDTLAAIRDLGLTDKFTFTSSGGGAMLDFLANGNLPGIEALTT